MSVDATTREKRRQTKLLLCGANLRYPFQLDAHTRQMIVSYTVALPVSLFLPTMTPNLFRSTPEIAERGSLMTCTHPCRAKGAAWTFAVPFSIAVDSGRRRTHRVR